MKTPGLIGMAVVGMAAMQAGCGSTSGARSDPAATASTREHGIPGLREVALTAAGAQVQAKQR